MVGLMEIAVLLILYLSSMVFAGMKGRERAKVRWTRTCVGVTVIWVALCTYTITHDSENAAGLAALGIIIGLIAAYVLNYTGRFCIDFMAQVILPDNRDVPPTQVGAEPVKAADIGANSLIPERPLSDLAKPSPVKQSVAIESGRRIAVETSPHQAVTEALKALNSARELCGREHQGALLLQSLEEAQRCTQRALDLT